jgi:hypothetical protein
MDAKMVVETNFSITDIEQFRDLLSKYFATRIIKQVIIALNEVNTNRSLSEYHSLIGTEIYSVLCKKYKSKTVMRTLKEQDIAVVENFRDLIKAYVSDLWTNMEKLILVISTNAEFRANCYELFFECLNKNIGGDINDKSREISKQLESFR